MKSSIRITGVIPQIALDNRNKVPPVQFKSPHGNMETPFSAPIVIDNGSYNVKSGLASDDHPRHIFPPVIANTLEDETLIGSQAKNNRSVVTKPVIAEHVNDWRDLESIWDHCFTSLNSDVSNSPVLLTRVQADSKAEKEKMFEILFEKFDVPAVYLENQSILSLHSRGLLTGVVVRSGLHRSEVTVIYEGLAINPPNSKNKSCLKFGGSDITFNLMANLRKSGWHCHFDSVNEIKEKRCYYRPSLSNEPDVSNGSSYRLPDGEVIEVDKKDLYEIPERMFRPKNHWQGLHEILVKSVEKCDLSIRDDLFGNIVLSGGNTLVTGFSDRLQNEILDLNRGEIGCNVIAPDNRAVSSWVGGAVIASLPNFRKMWISKKEYQKYGAKIVHMKCF